MEKPQQSNTGRTRSFGPDSLGVQVRAISLSKELWSAEVFTEAKGNVEWVVEEGSCQLHFHHLTSNRDKDYLIFMSIFS
jgi:hypothetical protein